MNPEPQPNLAPPGAGLPGTELLIGRIMFAWRRWRGNRDDFTERFQSERTAIRELIRPCDAEAGARRVLISRPRGLEDSSRYWSVWMTLDHLRIVNFDCVRIINSLVKGEMPAGTVSTAAVKPSPNATIAVTSAYEQACDALLAAVTETTILKTRLRYAHPWFGPLDAAGWQALAAGHMAIHRVQLERITAGLGCDLRSSP